MSSLWSLIPRSVLPLAIAGIGLALIVGLIKPRRAISILGGIVLSLLFAPIIGALIGALPFWIYLLLMVISFLSLLRVGIRALIGREATNHLVGALATDVVHLCLRMACFPFRVLGRILVR